jgi:hypothetical protein
MKHTHYPHRTPASGSSLGKFARNAAFLLTIAALVFAGTRDWKSDRPWVATLFDISDIQGFVTKVEQSASKKAALNAAIERAANPLERSLIQKGTLVRESDLVDASPATPQGLSRSGR